MLVLSRPDDPLLIIIRVSVVLVSIFTIYTSIVVEGSRRYILVSIYTAALASFTAIWANLQAFDLVSEKVYNDWRYVAAAAVYLAVIGKDIRYIHAAHLRKNYINQISHAEERLEKTATHIKKQ